MGRTRGCGLIKCWINTGGQVCLRTNHERALMCVITIMDARRRNLTYTETEDFSRLGRDPFHYPSTRRIRSLLLLIFFRNILLSIRSSTNSQSPLSVENFVSRDTTLPFAAENEKERSSMEEKEREGGEEEKRKRKERLINIYAAHGASI